MCKLKVIEAERIRELSIEWRMRRIEIEKNNEHDNRKKSQYHARVLRAYIFWRVDVCELFCKLLYYTLKIFAQGLVALLLIIANWSALLIIVLFEPK